MPLAGEVMRQRSGQLLVNQKRSHEDESSNAKHSCRRIECGIFQHGEQVFAY
jgi:hypothetical protein